VNAAVRKSAASGSDAAARTSAQISSGENTWMSPLLRTRNRSMFATGFEGRPYSLTARLKIACISTRRLFLVLLDPMAWVACCRLDLPG
jgi:hypothetical protein